MTVHWTSIRNEKLKFNLELLKTLIIKNFKLRILSFQT